MNNSVAGGIQHPAVAQALEDAISDELKLGGQLEEKTNTTAYVVYPYPVKHWLHLLLTLITLGFWSWVWLVIWIKAIARRHTVLLRVDPATGTITRTEAKA